MHTSGCRLIAWLHPLPAYLYHRSLLQLLLSLVLQACCTISILCSHSLQCGIIINSHLGEGRFPHHRMQWRFIATISKGLGEMYRMRERWKLCTYTPGFWVTTVWPCMSSEVDGKGNGNAQNHKWVSSTLWEDREKGANIKAMLRVCNMSCNQQFKLYKRGSTDSQNNQSFCDSNLTSSIWRKQNKPNCSCAVQFNTVCCLLFYSNYAGRFTS